MQLSVWLSDWLALRSQELKPRTLDSYRELCRLHIIPAIGAVELDQLTPMAITHMLAGICAEGHSRTAEMCFVLLRSALKDLEPSPMHKVHRPAHKQRSPKPWSDADCAVYLRALLGHKHQLALTLALLLGLRRGEVCGLRWEDIDFKEGVIHIRNQRQRLASGALVDLTPKSESSIRDLPIPETLQKLLRAHRQLSGYFARFHLRGWMRPTGSLCSALDCPTYRYTVYGTPWPRHASATAETCAPSKTSLAIHPMQLPSCTSCVS